MINRFSNNETFTPFAHGAHGETFLSHFILYPLRATSATRGTLGDMQSPIYFMIIFYFITSFAFSISAQDLSEYSNNILLPENFKVKYPPQQVDPDSIMSGYSYEPFFVLKSDSTFYLYKCCVFYPRKDSILYISVGDPGWIYKGTYKLIENGYCIKYKLKYTWYVPPSKNDSMLYQDTIHIINSNNFLYHQNKYNSVKVSPKRFGDQQTNKIFRGGF